MASSILPVGFSPHPLRVSGPEPHDPPPCLLVEALNTASAHDGRLKVALSLPGAAFQLPSRGWSEASAHGSLSALMPRLRKSASRGDFRALHEFGVRAQLDDQLINFANQVNRFNKEIEKDPKLKEALQAKLGLGEKLHIDFEGLCELMNTQTSVVRDPACDNETKRDLNRTMGNLLELIKTAFDKLSEDTFTWEWGLQRHAKDGVVTFSDFFLHRIQKSTVDRDVPAPMPGSGLARTSMCAK